MKNIFAENCFLDSPQLDTAFRIKNNAVRGGTLEDIYIRNMRVGQVGKQVEMEIGLKTMEKLPSFVIFR